MPHQDSWTTRLKEYIANVLPWAHGHQRKGITTFVDAISEKQTGNQAELARGLGTQEAAVKRLSRLLHNERLAPHRLADAVLAQALGQLPPTGRVRRAVDWTIAGSQHLLVVSLVTGGRAVPLYWRAYAATVLKGRMRRYETAVIRRVVTRVQREIGRRRLIVTADRGFADVALVEVLSELGVEFIIRVKGSTKVYFQRQWCKLNTLRFVGNARQRNLGRLAYCERAPHRLWVTLSRARDRTGQWDTWYLIANRCRRAQATAAEYARRFGCEEGLRDAKGELGVARARIKDSTAWSRLFAVFALALLVGVSWAVTRLLPRGSNAVALLRRVASRRRGRWDLRLVSAMVRLLHADKGLLAPLWPSMQCNWEARLVMGPDFRRVRQKSRARVTRRARPAFEVAQWDAEENRWVTWEEQQTESWIKKAAEQRFDQWNHPAFWFSKELELNNAAEFLWSADLEHRMHAPVGGRPHVINFPATALMLAAMSIECLFKGALFCRLAYPPRRDQVSGIAKGAHNLADLLVKVGWRSNANDRLVLKCLSHYVRWAGRYPLPKSSSELAEARIDGMSTEEAWGGTVGKYF